MHFVDRQTDDCRKEYARYDKQHGEAVRSPELSAAKRSQKLLGTDCLAYAPMGG